MPQFGNSILLMCFSNTNIAFKKKDHDVAFWQAGVSRKNFKTWFEFIIFVMTFLLVVRDIYVFHLQK